MRLGGCQHGVRFRGVHGHARLTHDVFASGQYRTRHFAMHIGPSPDDDGVGVIGGYQRPPVFVDLRNIESFRNPLGRLTAAITDADDLDPWDRLEPGDVPDTGV